MRFSTIAAALTAPLLATAIPMKHKRASDTDILVLQFAEVLERLETDFYQQALDKFVEEDFIAAGINIPDIAIQNFQGILEHELAHTKFLNAALSAVGAQPVQGCTFNFDAVLTDVATMAAVARVVEAAGVGAYLGAGTLVEDKNILVAAASILTIEARHQTVLNSINGATAVPQSFDIALTPPQVLALAGGFISGCSLGIEANAPLAITNEGPIGPGTLLTFDSPALAGVDASTLSCQMLVGSPNPAISLPLAECVVPDGINGPVAIFITTDAQPLAADVVVQDGTTTLAGPTLAFLDTVPDALGSLIREGVAPIDSSEQLTPDEASSALEGATGVVPAPTDALAPAPTDGAVAPPPVDGAPATPENAQQAPAAPLIVELGHSTIPL